MRPTPYQTYLAERLQSAKGLGWDFEKNGVGKPGAVWAGFSLPNIFRWFSFVR